MTALIIAIVLILVLSLFLGYPLLRGLLNPEYFFTSGKRTRSTDELRRLVVLENLRDLRVEQEHGKLSEGEFQELALPLARELEELEKRQGPADADALKPMRNRLGVVCPVCGALNRNTDEDRSAEYCIQCGFEFPHEKS